MTQDYQDHEVRPAPVINDVTRRLAATIDDVARELLPAFGHDPMKCSIDLCEACATGDEQEELIT